MAKKLVFTTNNPAATTDYAAADGTWKTIPGGGGGGSGTVTSVATTAPITGGTITTSGTIGITQASGSTDGYLSSANWNTFNSKQDNITGAATTITTANLTANRAVISNGSGKIAVSTVTDTEVGYLSGVTSAIQTQLNAKQNTVSLTTTGTSGVATFNSTTGALNIPTYAAANSGTSFLAGNVGNGNTSVGAGATQYLNVQGAALSIAESIRVLMMPQDCTLSRLWFHTGLSQPGSGTLVITLRKNLADTALVITIASGAAPNFYSNLVNSVAFTSGDRCSVKVVNNASAPSASVVGISVMVTI